MKTDRRLVIGITCSMNDAATRLHANRSYFNAIWKSGGIPVFLPFTDEAKGAREFADDGLFDAFLFSGGVDVAPRRYGEEITGDGVEICERRDAFELELARILYYEKPEKPVLGICRGVQLLNVAAGGSLHQDVQGHRQEEAGSVTPFTAKLTAGTFLASLIGGEETKINSFHHQAVKDPAPGFTVSATSAHDGLIEAIEPRDPQGRYFIAVQWHPELFYDESESSRVIFRSFVEAAKNKNY
jgi:putative glutamine amidotransferase